MKISIIGGGPAGLYLALLLKKAGPTNAITVYERNGPDDTFGWGVVFSGKTMAQLKAADAETHAEITASFEAWDNVAVIHRDEKILVHGNSFSGIARLQLLKILQRRCERLGVNLCFRNEIGDVEAVRNDCDLLVGSDGVNSAVRQTYRDRFKPSLDVRSNRYIWYGTKQLFPGLTLTFCQSEDGVFAAHSYKFDKHTSTFIIECDQETWQRAAFATMSDTETRRYLESVFCRDLKGNALLSNNSKWINFVLVKNEEWSFENCVLLGDSLHTAHFSIGSGTKLAMEDAISLAERLQQAPTVHRALAAFQDQRKPVIEEYQAAAYESMLWFENARQFVGLAPIELTFKLMTRSGRVDEDELRKRDPEFIASYEEWQKTRSS